MRVCQTCPIWEFVKSTATIVGSGKGEVSLYRWPPVWLVWIILFLQIKTKIVSSHTADSKPVKQEVNGTVILPPLVFPSRIIFQLASPARKISIRILLGSWNYFRVNLLTLFCKLDNFINISNIYPIAMKWFSLQKEWVNLLQKCFMRLTPGWLDGARPPQLSLIMGF